MLKQQRKISLIIESKKRWRTQKKKILISYGGATLYDQLQLLEAKTQEQRAEFFYTWINKHADKPLSPQDWIQISPKIGAIVEHIMQTAFATGKKRKEAGERSPYSSYLTFLCKELCVSPKELLTYTIQEIDYLSEGILRNLNAQTEEGQKKNRLKAQEHQAGNMLEEKRGEIEAFLKN